MTFAACSSRRWCFEAERAILVCEVCPASCSSCFRLSIQLARAASRAASRAATSASLTCWTRARSFAGLDRRHPRTPGWWYRLNEQCANTIVTYGVGECSSKASSGTSSVDNVSGLGVLTGASTSVRSRRSRPAPDGGLSYRLPRNPKLPCSSKLPCTSSSGTSSSGRFERSSSPTFPGSSRKSRRLFARRRRRSIRRRALSSPPPRMPRSARELSVG